MAEGTNDLAMLRCPGCKGQLAQQGDIVQILICKQCHHEYSSPADGKYYNFYIDPKDTATSYPPEIEHLYFTSNKILALSPPKANRLLNLIFGRGPFMKAWGTQLEELKDTVRSYGLSENERVGSMVDDYTSQAFLAQKNFTRLKSKVIMRYISSVKHTGNRVLHIGCGGLSNDAIPIAYSSAGYLNYGIDAVQSYVEEFLIHGKSHIANALFLPYANNAFDIVNFTDILEHLFDPLRGLQEANRVLKKGGYLILDTPNQRYLNRKSPLFLMEYYLGAIFPSILRPKIITGEWEGQTLLHTEFTRKELNCLLSNSGFEPCEVTAVTLVDSGHLPLRSFLKELLRAALGRIAPTGAWYALTRKA